MRAYAQTAVAPEKSQNAIKRLLGSHGASNVAFASATVPIVLEGLRAPVVLDGRPYGFKIAVPGPADSGVIDIRELLLPFLVTKDGRTVGQIVMDDMPKALMAPKGILE